MGYAGCWHFSWESLRHILGMNLHWKKRPHGLHNNSKKKIVPPNWGSIIQFSWLKLNWNRSSSVRRGRIGGRHCTMCPVTIHMGYGDTEQSELGIVQYEIGDIRRALNAERMLPFPSKEQPDKINPFENSGMWWDCGIRDRCRYPNELHRLIIAKTGSNPIVSEIL